MADDEISDIESLARDLETSVLYRAEGGAFSDQQDALDEIVKLIREARTAESQQPETSREKLLKANTLLADAVRQRGLLWRMVHIWAIFPIAYFLALAALTAYISIRYADEIKDMTLLSIPVSMVAYALVGGIARGLWWVTRKVQAKGFRPQFTLPYLVGPWIASALGIFTYFAIKGGLIVLSGEGDNVNELTLPVFMFLSGYSWEWVSGLIDKITKRT